MKDCQLVLERILHYNSVFIRDEVKQVLVIFEEEKKFFLGDCCVRFDRLRYLRSFFVNASIDINFLHRHNIELYNALLKNNPNIDHIHFLDWDDIDFESYDTIICVSYDEERFIDFLRERYGELIINGQFKLAVFSMSKLFLDPEQKGVYIFPVNTDIIEFARIPQPLELYISKEERTFGNKWLESHGVVDGESLFILLDSTSSNLKLLNIWVYFELLTALLERENVKVINFDENNIGKEEFYREWLGSDHSEKMIFSKNLTLREVFCIISSKYTKLVFGPCTGIMHCASSIYNHSTSNGMRPDDIPLIITYTGKDYLKNQNANAWWGNSPLVNCLLLKERNGIKEIVLLTDLTNEEKNSQSEIPCSEYSSDMLISFIEDRL